MSKVKWKTTDSEKIKMSIAQYGKALKKYHDSNINEIVNDWPEKIDTKMVKITSGRGNIIELEIYSSGPFTTYRKRINPNVEIVNDRFAVNIIRTKLGDTAKEVIKAIDNLKEFKLVIVKLTNENYWITKEQLYDVLNKLDEAMDYVKAYEVMDILAAD